MTNTTCTGTAAITPDPELTAQLISEGITTDGVTVTTYGRRVCGTCHGLVLPTSKGTLRKHVVLSNRPNA